MGSSSEIFLNILNKHKYLYHTAVFSVIVSVITNTFFTIPFGLLGATFSFSSTIILTSIIRIIYLKKYLNISLINIKFVFLISISFAVIIEFFFIYIKNYISHFISFEIFLNFFFISIFMICFYRRIIAIFMYLEDNNFIKDLK